MARRRRGVRVFKWLGAGLCVLLAALVAVSWKWELLYSRCFESSAIEFAIFAGRLGVLAEAEFVASPFDGNVLLELLPKPFNGFRAERIDHELSLDWLWPDRPLYRQANGLTIAYLPLWIPFLAILLPTLLLWFLDRRRPLPGRCRRCNYDLTGNLSGVCPECGTAAQIEPHAG